VGPNKYLFANRAVKAVFQSSVRINVGPNFGLEGQQAFDFMFQSSVRINVGPNDLWIVGGRGGSSSFNPP